MASRGSKDVADQHPHRSEDTSESAGKGREDTRTAQRSRDLVLTRFWKLPLELRERILVEACGPPALHRWTIAGRSTDCTTTMLRLLRASKVFHPVVLPLLYRNVRVTRPSALDMFERTLAERPEFGKMVERLHIGPDEELPLNWWPIRGVGSGDSRRTLFRLNLRSEGKHWRGCKSYEVDMQTFDDEDPDKAGALEEAFEVAAEAFDIGLPTRPDYMEHDKWTAGVLQVQAIMELYYLEMLRCENRMKRAKGAEPARKRTRSENNPSGRDAQPAYPRLYLEDDELRNMAPRAEVDASRPVFKVTCTRFWKRMYSAGAPTDRFDHRLLFAACQSPWLAEGPDHVTHSGDNYPPHEVTALDEYQLERASKVSTVTGVLWPRRTRSGLKYLRTRTSRHLGIWAPSPPQPTVPAGATVPFPRPAARCLGKAATARDPALPSVARLRICNPLSDEELASISGTNDALSQLQEFQWSMVQKLHGSDGRNLVTAVQRHFAGGASVAVAAAPEELPAANEEHLGGTTQERRDGEQSRSSEARRTTSVEARLHRDNVAAILDAAPEEVAQAWREGSSLPGQRHRLKLTGRGPPSDKVYSDERFQGTQELYDEGREWWEAS